MRIYKVKVNYIALVFFGTVLSYGPAFSEVILKMEGVYFQNFLVSSNNPNSNLSYFDFSTNLTLSSRSRYFVGLIFSTYASTEKDSSSVTTYWLEQNTGLSTGFYLGKRKQLSISGSYMLIANSSYKVGASAAETWSGNGYSGKITYYADYSEKLKISLSFIYAQNNYLTARSGSTITNVSKSKTYLLPVLGVQYTF